MTQGNSDIWHKEILIFVCYASLVYITKWRQFLANVHVHYMSSSVRLSPVCNFVRPTQAIEIFGNVSTPFGTRAICDLSVNVGGDVPANHRLILKHVFDFLLVLIELFLLVATADALRVNIDWNSTFFSNGADWPKNFRENFTPHQPFLPHCMKCRRGLAMRILSVRLSVRPSVRPSVRLSVCLSVRLSVCLSVCLSHAWSLTKWKKDRSRFLYHTKEHLS